MSSKLWKEYHNVIEFKVYRYMNHVYEQNQFNSGNESNAVLHREYTAEDTSVW